MNPRVQPRLFRPLDGLLIALILVSAAWTLPWMRTAIGKTAIVKVSGKKVMRLDLKGPERYAMVMGSEGPIDLEWGEKGVRVLKAPCANPICVRTGFILHQGNRIVCVPSRLEVEVVSGAGSIASLDGVTF